MKYPMDSKKIKVIKKMTKTIGIGYTLYEYDGKTKRSISMTKAHPGNIKQELSLISPKANTIYIKSCFPVSQWFPNSVPISKFSKLRCPNH